MADNHGVLTVLPSLSEDELAAITDPAALLERAWALEPWGRYSERSATLDALERLLHQTGSPGAPAGREWRLELLAERSIDAGRERRLEQAVELAEQVVREADPDREIARGRALLSLGQALVWNGTENDRQRGARAFAEAAERFERLGRADWQGSALLRWGYSGCYTHGDLVRAQELMARALTLYDPDGQRYAGALVPYSDVLIDLGDLTRADEILDRAAALADRHANEKAATEVAWGRARVAAARQDGRATERLVREAERASAGQDWFATHIGISFLLEAAELLDRVGCSEEARGYLHRAAARPDALPEELMQATAVLMARSGDPAQALAELQRLARGAWLEKRLVWRHTLLEAWATFRAGREGAGPLAARALDQAVAGGTVEIARTGEPELVAALAPRAERATGSAVARELMLDGRELVVRLFGTPTACTADGTPLTLPPGMPGKLLRLLALHEHGVAVDVVLETFFPEATPTAGRQRLRQVLRRLRVAAGDVVVRDGETLRLVPAWVDAREFLRAATRVRGAHGARAVQLAYAALALVDGPLLPSDPYDPWAERAREQVRYRHLDLLDRVARDAAARDSHAEAITALEAALVEEPDDEDRRSALAEQREALARTSVASDL